MAQALCTVVDTVINQADTLHTYGSPFYLGDTGHAGWTYESTCYFRE